MLERSLVAFGRHATAADGIYWIFALLVVAIGVGLSLVTGLWGLFGIVAGSFAVIAYYARRRFEKSERD
jgi:hypothetical protein